MKRRNYLTTLAALLPTTIFTTTTSKSNMDKKDPTNPRSHKKNNTDNADNSLQVELHEYDFTVYEGHGTKVAIKVTNPTDGYLTETILLRPHYGQRLLRGEFTIPPHKSRTYTSLWQINTVGRNGYNKLSVYSKDDTDSTAISVETPAMLSTNRVGYDDVSVNEEITLDFTLKNHGTLTANSEVTITHHMASDIEHPTETPPNQETIHQDVYNIDPAGFNETNETSHQITFTPTKPGNHIFRFTNESGETSYGISVSD